MVIAKPISDKNGFHENSLQGKKSTYIHFGLNCKFISLLFLCFIFTQMDSIGNNFKSAYDFMDRSIGQKCNQAISFPPDDGLLFVRH